MDASVRLSPDKYYELEVTKGSDKFSVHEQQGQGHKCDVDFTKNQLQNISYIFNQAYGSGDVATMNQMYELGYIAYNHFVEEVKPELKNSSDTQKLQNPSGPNQKFSNMTTMVMRINNAASENPQLVKISPFSERERPSVESPIVNRAAKEIAQQQEKPTNLEKENTPTRENVKNQEKEKSSSEYGKSSTHVGKLAEQPKNQPREGLIGEPQISEDELL